MSDRCHYITDPVMGRVFIPGCMGGVNGGSRLCTCPRRKISEKSKLKNEIRRLENRIKAIREQLAAVNDKRNGLGSQRK